MATNNKLDNVDLQIMRALQDNGRLTLKELAASVNLSSTPVYERLRRLETVGYIKKYMAVLDAEKLNQGFVVFCNIKMAKINADIDASFRSMVNEIPQVTECYNISGNYDYLLKIHVKDMNNYKELMLNKLSQIDHLASIESIFVMDELKHNPGLYL